jgi:sterol desaturase/sphingolipid hydroxylase (fatty acid hydroxylase superfamily)
MSKLYVSNDPEASARIFKSDFLEKFTRVHWTIPLWLFVPVIIYFIYRSVAVFYIDVPTVILYFVLGLFVWTFTEYSIHRWAFHFHAKSEMGKRFLFMSHGVHHDYPSDKWRLVMPPSVSIPLAAFFYFLFYFIFLKLLGTPWLTSPFFAGFITGYVFYDITHYALHHFNIRKAFWKDLKVHHTKHHFQDPYLGFGVSNKLWDIVFKTGYEDDKK